jgi:hypothetical protein
MNGWQITMKSATVIVEISSSSIAMFYLVKTMSKSFSAQTVLFLTENMIMKESLSKMSLNTVIRSGKNSTKAIGRSII